MRSEWLSLKRRSPQAENPFFRVARDRFAETTRNNSMGEGAGVRGLSRRGYDKGILKQVLGIFGVFVQGEAQGQLGQRGKEGVGEALNALSKENCRKR